MAVYLAARDLAGIAFIGTHQFLIVVNEANPYPPARLGEELIPARSLGGRKTGYVIGAQNRGNLVVEFFEESDYQAAREYFDKSLVKWYKADFDTEVARVDFGRTSEADAIKRLFELVNTYYLNQNVDPITYPRAGMGFNSNSWAQTVIALAGGRVKANMTGVDVGHDKRIPATYFDPICPVVRRPKLN